MSSIREPPKDARVDWDGLRQLVDQATPGITREAFLELWAKGKVAAAGYPAALETLRMLAPASVNPADL